MLQGCAFRNRHSHNWSGHTLSREENNEPCSRLWTLYKVLWNNEAHVQQVRSSAINGCPWWLCLPPAMFAFSGCTHKKRGCGRGGKIVLCSSLAVVLAALLFFIPWTVCNSNRNQFEKDLVWVSFIPLLALSCFTVNGEVCVSFKDKISCHSMWKRPWKFRWKNRNLSKVLPKGTQAAGTCFSQLQRQGEALSVPFCPLEGSTEHSLSVFFTWQNALASVLHYF